MPDYFTHHPCTRSALLLLVCLAGTCHAQDRTVTRLPVLELKPLLMQAAAQGQAHGVLTGVAAEVIARRLGATAPIEVDVQRLHPLAPAGCARLEVNTRQRDVPTKGQPRDQSLVYQISYCADGRFPPQSQP